MKGDLPWGGHGSPHLPNYFSSYGIGKRGFKGLELFMSVEGTFPTYHEPSLLHQKMEGELVLGDG